MSKDEEMELDGVDELPTFTLEEILAEYALNREKEEPDEIRPIPMEPEQDQRPPSPPPAAQEPEPPEEPQKAEEMEAASPQAPEPEKEEEEEKPEEKKPFRPYLRLLRRESEPPQPEEPSSEPEEPEPPRAPEEDGGQVTPFPSRAAEGFFARKLGDLRRRADQYAEHMFEDEGTEESEEVRQAERYIPGVDQEEPEEDAPPVRRRRQPPPIPDLSPQELFRRYDKGVRGVRWRIFLSLVISILALYLSFATGLRMPLPPVLTDQLPLQRMILAGMLGVVMVLTLDAVLLGLLHLITLRPELDSIVALACVANLADALLMDKLTPEMVRHPFCGLSALALTFLLWGNYAKRLGLRVACRTAASVTTPYLVTLDERKWNGRDAYAKWSGEPAGFGRQIQASDGAQRIFHVAAPLLLVGCLLCAVLSSIGRERPNDFVWCLSANLTAASSYSAALCYGIPWGALAQRLAKSGAALAGWDGVTSTGGGSSVLLSDEDLFPPGTVQLNGIKIFGDFSVDRVVGSTATLIRDSGSGLDKLFHDLLRAQGTVYRRATNFCCYEGGGLSGDIRGEQILVGTASFMHLMDVPLPQGMHVKNAVFCAIGGELAGLFVLKYTLNGAVAPALHALIRNHVVPVMATRDFNITPEMLRQRFKLPADHMEYPAIERRVELSDPNQEHSAILTAVLCRTGVDPFTEAAVGGKRLRRGVRASAGFAVLGATLGLLLSFYLTFLQSYTSLTPGNLLVFLLMWLVPTFLISDWVNRY
ncbi:hypothetical protein H7U37_11440 [Pseudoflavonifractor phocaeensis]|uniref:hypothetical protein n=1 Tax=Pseudoflavonifractor phocaeensis TaxID=1870988 RepID=UPI00195C216C|nr:hypothetical protein [Pseudoflavonifractor phocaeensis]MBM6939129.1 hypothetical protein [Pseudoflavonifractor phocaeensis]